MRTPQDGAPRSARRRELAHQNAALSLLLIAALSAACGTGSDEKSPSAALADAGAGGGAVGAVTDAAGGNTGGALGMNPPPGSSVDGGGTVILGGAIDAGGLVRDSGSDAGPSTPPPGGSCAMSAERIRITEVDVGSKVLTGDSEQTFYMLALSPIASGGSRLAWLSGDNQVHLAQLDANDQVVGTPITLPAHDFSDLYADDKGGVVLLTRDAEAGGTLNCGNINNLCGNAASYPTTYACYDMYMVRFDGASETWATKLTESSATRPPYATSPTDSNRTTFIWSWYGHHGRIASDGSRWAAYYGASISGSSQALTRANCAQSDSTLTVGIDIHQGDQMRIVDATGAVQTGGFVWGCSHSYYERIVYDPTTKKFVQICETDASNQLLFAPPSFTGSGAIYAIDMQREIGNYSNISDIVVGAEGGYWVTVSKSRANAAGMADVHLLHFSSGAPDKDLTISSDPTLNNRSNHLAKYGSARLIAAWESASAANDFTTRTTGRKFYIQTHNAATGEAEGGPYAVDIVGNRYYAFRDYPDGSVAYPSAGSSSTKLKILRILPCN